MTQAVAEMGMAQAVAEIGMTQAVVETMDLPGIHVTPDHFEELGLRPDPLKRDVHSLETRKEQWERTEALHQEHREDPVYSDHYGLWLVSAPLGKGKTLSCADRLRREFYEMGVPVFHTGSLLFGNRLSVIEGYTFPDIIPPGSAVFIDEVHAYVERYAEASLRQRTLSQATTSLRKIQATVMGASAAEWTVGMSYKAACKWLTYPSQWRPESGYRFPPWCYIKLTSVGPQPWRGKMLGEEFGAVDMPPLRRRIVRRLEPSEVWASSKLVDTFDRVPIGAGYQTSADAIKRAVSGEIPVEELDDDAKWDMVMGALATAIERGDFSRFEATENKNERRVPAEFLAHLVKRPTGLTLSPKEMKTLFSSRGIYVSSRGAILVDELLDQFTITPA